MQSELYWVENENISGKNWDILHIINNAIRQSCNLFFPFWHPEYFLPEIISEKFSARKFLLENVCQKLSDKKISITILSEK